MIRVRRTTRDRLQALILAAVSRGGALGHPAWLDGEELTLDRMISRLIDHLEKDRARSKKWSQSRARRQLGNELALLERRYEINPAVEVDHLGNVREVEWSSQDRK